MRRAFFCGFAIGIAFSVANSFAAEEKSNFNNGVIAIAPFHVKAAETAAALEPKMSTTSSPTAKSVFTFTIDKHLSASVSNSESALISAVPTNRKVKVVVLLDGKPFETFAVNLGESPRQRICLWLYPGYWHWIDNGWNSKLGCPSQIKP